MILPAAGPQITGDLRTYSQRYQIPAPDLQVIDWHNAPVASTGNPAAAAGAQEGTLDLEMAHALAPSARLIYMEVTGGSGQAYSTAPAWLVTHQHVDVVSFSEGIPEAWVKSTNGGYQTLLSLRDGVQAAARAGVTVGAGTGDYGATQPEDTDPGKLYSFPVTLWPASDPLVTAVGGTRLHTGAAGSRVSADTAFSSIGGFVGGAGLSAVFTRSAWQNSVRKVTGSRRGVADVSMDASPCSPVLAYTGFASLPGDGDVADDGDVPDEDTRFILAALSYAFPAWTITYSPHLRAWIACSRGKTICQNSAVLLCAALTLIERRQPSGRHGPVP